jgi:hypothetical protein
MDEFNKPGVYILRGQAQDQVTATIYIGEGDPVRGRLDSHFAKKAFWDEVFVCVDDGKLNKAHIQHLESRLVTLAKGAGFCTLDNDNAPQLPTLSQAEATSVENYLNKLLSVLRALGLKSFEQSSHPEDTSDAGKTLAARIKIIPTLVIRGILKPNDRLHLIKNLKPGLIISDEKAKKATFISEKEIRWDLDGQVYSLSGLCKKICERFGGKSGSSTFQGPFYWAKEGQEKPLSELVKDGHVM